MSLVPWKGRSAQQELPGPTDLLRAFESRLDRLFGDRVFDFAENWFDGPRAYGPAVDITDSGNEITVIVDAPGMHAKDFDINVAGDILTIGGQISEEEEKREQQQGWYRRERRHSSFQRTVRLPAHVAAEKIKAEYHDGVLTIHCAKPPEMRAKHIEVKG